MSEQLSRLVVLDTETTGMNFSGAPHIGHHIIEIGAVEIINRRLTGRTFHVYIKPPREVDEEAINVHGITNEFLQDKPAFAEIANEFIAFIQGAELIIHNAPFDVGFIDQELSFLPTPTAKTEELCEVTDSLQMARKMYPGKKNNLDALCSRLGIDNSKRIFHGALLDAEILADVFLLMTGGQIALLTEEQQAAEHENMEEEILTPSKLDYSKLITLSLNPEEQQAHEKMLELINQKSKGQCIWLKNLADHTENIH